MRTNLLRLVMGIFTLGWVIPLGIAETTMLSYYQVEILPRTHGQNPINSFPFIAFAKDALTVSCIWFAAAAGFWLWRYARVSKLKKNSP